MSNTCSRHRRPYSLRVKWAGSVHLHSHGLHVCLFFPEGAPPALGRQWKSCWCVTGGGGEEAPRPGLESPIATQSPAEGPAPTGGTAVRPWRRFEHAIPSAQILFHTGTGAAAALWVKKVHVQVFHLHSKHTWLLKQCWMWSTVTQTAHGKILNVV